ncbi:hypothetical protein BDA96_10G116100 [Sorghum bicolor]|uniref:Uncharacterized protein n=1 Tax=Sorghum bicolor TaxID=4558 RepID=A0A921Q397_SORBI|nr:hypothetical protein BDA96_10G116100 [Sorghum bicolor]
MDLLPLDARGWPRWWPAGPSSPWWPAYLAAVIEGATAVARRWALDRRDGGAQGCQNPRHGHLVPSHMCSVGDKGKVEIPFLK